MKDVWPEAVVSEKRPDPKNQMWSFHKGPPRVASYRSFSFWVRESPVAGVRAVQASFVNVVRKEPEKAFPPDFVTVLTIPPVKRPYSAEMAATEVVVSWMASSMKRVFGVFRTLSWTTAPSTVNRLSKEGAPPITTAPFGPA